MCMLLIDMKNYQLLMSDHMCPEIQVLRWGEFKKRLEEGKNFTVHELNGILHVIKSQGQLMDPVELLAVKRSLDSDKRKQYSPDVEKVLRDINNEISSFIIKAEPLLQKRIMEEELHKIADELLRTKQKLKKEIPTKLSGMTAEAVAEVRAVVAEMITLDEIYGGLMQRKETFVGRAPQILIDSGIPDPNFFTGLVYRASKDISEDADKMYFKNNKNFIMNKFILNDTDKTAFSEAVDRGDVKNALEILQKNNIGLFDTETVLKESKITGLTGNVLTYFSAGTEYRIDISKQTIADIEAGFVDRVAASIYLALRAKFAVQSHEAFEFEASKEMTKAATKYLTGTLLDGNVALVTVISSKGMEVAKFEVGLKSGLLYIEDFGPSYVSSVYGRAEGNIPFILNPKTGLMLACRLGGKGEFGFSGTQKPPPLVAHLTPELRIPISNVVTIDIYTGAVTVLDTKTETVSVGGTGGYQITIRPKGKEWEKFHFEITGYIRAMKPFDYGKIGKVAERFYLEFQLVGFTVRF